MSDEHIEAILELAPGADPDAVERWLSEHGLTALTMRAGLLLTGDRGGFERVFGPLPEPLPQEPVELTPPPDLADAVASVTIPPVPNVR